MTLVCPEGPTKFITLWKPIHIMCNYHPACSTTSPYFYLAPHYAPTTATLQYFSGSSKPQHDKHISTGFSHVWQHLENHWNEMQLQNLACIPLVPVNQLYKHMISGTNPITPFTSPEESTGDTWYQSGHCFLTQEFM